MRVPDYQPAVKSFTVRDIYNGAYADLDLGTNDPDSAAGNSVGCSYSTNGYCGLPLLRPFRGGGETYSATVWHPRTRQCRPLGLLDPRTTTPTSHRTQVLRQVHDWVTVE